MIKNYQSKLLRNGRCLCGSGLKYKKCCGAASIGTKNSLIAQPSFSSHYEISTDPVKDLHFEKLDPLTQKRIIAAASKVENEPTEVIPELEKLITENPKISLLWNYLTKAYAKLKNRPKVEELIYKTYLEFPDYLFAKTAYGELCLDKGMISKIGEVFEQKFTLTELYPHRKRYQVAELIAFYQFMIRYFCQLGQYKLAKEYLHVLEKVAPSLPFIEQFHTEILSIKSLSKTRKMAHH